jgi:SAM-dependent methyltransferase
MKHLDLGCGLDPKNHFNANELYGCDIRDLTNQLSLKGIKFKSANLVLESIPFENNYFDSVSAMDFLEHIPRQIIDADGKIRNSFVELMNEIYRVLKPNGIFFASTPIFPHPWAFIDPTHVNIMSDKTYTYFIGPENHGQMYGFKGNFSKKQVYMDTPNNYAKKNESNFKKTLRRFHRKFFKGGLSHQVWILQSIK